jgi:NAD(P)-dependent dehydrogenase (short-subunit alcohol dehydrogenase family)
MAGGSIVITGASTGIGEACALALDRLGFRVFAGVRRFADGEALKAKGSGRLTPVSLDVTSLESIHSAVKLVGPGPIAGLVNNAGIVVSGPIELVPLELWRNQLEVNVLGRSRLPRRSCPPSAWAEGESSTSGQSPAAVRYRWLDHTALQSSPWRQFQIRFAWR